MADRIITVRLDEAAQQRLAELVESTGTTRSDVVRSLILGEGGAIDHIWLVHDHGHDEPHGSIYATEVEALREALEFGQGVTRVPVPGDMKNAIAQKRQAPA